MAVSAGLAGRSSHPAPAEAVLDLNHLARMTLGERELEREVLTLFVRQTEILLPRIRQADGKAAATLAHTLKGSALGIGAFRVAQAAEDIEQAAIGSTQSAVDALGAAVAEVRIEIEVLLRGS